MGCRAGASVKRAGFPLASAGGGRGKRGGRSGGLAGAATLSQRESRGAGKTGAESRGQD